MRDVVGGFYSAFCLITYWLDLSNTGRAYMYTFFGLELKKFI